MHEMTYITRVFEHNDEELEIRLRVEFDYSLGEAARIHGPPELCYPGDQPEINRVYRVEDEHGFASTDPEHELSGALAKHSPLL